MQGKSTIIGPFKGKYIDVHVDVYFSGNWDSKETEDTDTRISRHGYIIIYARCPLLHKSQLQTEFDLSSI